MKRFLIMGLMGLAALAAAPAHANSAVVTADSINYVSDNASENVLILDDPQGNLIGVYNDVANIGTFDLGLDTILYFGTPRRVINIQTGGGTDGVNYRLISNAVGAPRAIQLDFGAAEPQPVGAVAPSSFTFDTGNFSLSNAGPVGSNFDFEITGGGNPENVVLNFDAISFSKVSINADLGLGDDNATLDLGTAGQTFATIDAQIGLGGARIANSANLRYTAPQIFSSLNVDVTGGAQADSITALYASTVGFGRLVTDASGGAGNDQLTSTLDLNSFSVLTGGEVRVTENGDDGADTVAVGRMDGPSAVLQGLLELSLTGGAGNDAVSATLADPSSFAGGFGGTGGTLRVRADGGAGVDGVTGIAGALPNANFNFDVVLRGGAGTDSLRSEIYVGLPTPITATGNFGPLRTVLLDGGSDPDTASTFSNGIVVPFTIRSANP